MSVYSLSPNAILIATPYLPGDEHIMKNNAPYLRTDFGDLKIPEDGYLVEFPGVDFVIPVSKEEFEKNYVLDEGFTPVQEDPDEEPEEDEPGTDDDNNESGESDDEGTGSVEDAETGG